MNSQYTSGEKRHKAKLCDQVNVVLHLRRCLCGCMLTKHKPSQLVWFLLGSTANSSVNSWKLELHLFSICVLLVCLCADLPQITTIRPSTVQHRLSESAVHLAGSSILTRIHTTVGGTGQREHNSNVLMHALSDPAVSLLIGATAAG